MVDDESQDALVEREGDSTEAEASLGDMLDRQDEEAQRFAVEFLKKVIRLRGVGIVREEFLRRELRKAGLPVMMIEDAISSTPIEAGVTVRQLDELATRAIGFESRKSAAMSFASGLPGGLAIVATVPADITQYYVHAFRVMQKLAYLYGWKDFIKDLDHVDDETIGQLALFLGVMMGVGGASASLGTFANRVARPALQKTIAQQALSKTAWYGPVKQVLRMVGIKLTKDSLAKGITRAVPLAGGIFSGGMTFLSLKGQAQRLQQTLRELPPPGVDAEGYLARVRDTDDRDTREPDLFGESARASNDVVEDPFEGLKYSAGGVAGGAEDVATGAAARTNGFAGAIRAGWRLPRREMPSEVKEDASDDHG